MKNERLILKIVELRIKLQSLCDGFNKTNANKKSVLTMDKKVLFVLSKNKNCTPSVLIETLGVAKSNLALLCKSLIKEGLITQSKGDLDKRSIFYNITEKGKNKLNEFCLSLENDTLKNVSKQELSKLENNFDEIINFFNIIKSGDIK